jgi:hypothetical protein
VADVNGDGLDDFYVCGALGQPGTLMIQQKNGTFTEQDKALFEADKGSEGVDALFFDANGDGKPDLWVVAGGNEASQSADMLADKLYINNGDGHFTKKSQFTPPLNENKSCITAADVDHDGDMDVFVGNLCDPKSYGLLQTSYLLINDGKANFSIAGNNVIALTKTGMVTTASFADLNNDGWQDLVVSGEFMPMKIFMNNKGIFTETDIPGSTGLWQTVCTADVNGDGFTDILAGNWGHNNKLYSGKNGPVKMYVKDFDKNNSIEQVLCYTIDKKEYTFLAKDELERALPVLKKAYLKYDEVAGKTVQFMFYDLFAGSQELKAETLSSASFINDGKGNFTFTALPEEIQMAPVFSFSPLQQKGVKSWLAAGNFYGVTPYEGRYDALLPTAFSFNKSNSSFQAGVFIPSVNGEVRDMKWINCAGGNRVMIIAGNNQGLLFYK